MAFAGPAAMSAVLGAEAAVRNLPARVARAAHDPAVAEAEYVNRYRDAFFNPDRAADVGQIDEVIEPRETRPRLIRALELLRTKVQQNPPKKHGLFPA
jgi:acetyl-CoA/propionyl-CoA carboxylase carboxyl transferase subunit